MLDLHRRLLLGGSLAGLAAQPALADTPFTSFAFAATGAPNKSTMPDRLSERKRVRRDFGALGDGRHDDTAAFQAAINAAILDGGGEVYVEPVLYPNFYRITQPLVFNQVGGGGKDAVDIVGVKGEDVHGSVIRGNFAGFVFDNPDSGGVSNLSRVHGLIMFNDNPNGGCIRHNSSVTGEIAHCRVSAKYGVWCDSNSYNCLVRNNDFIGPGFNSPGSIGLLAGQTTALNNSFTGWETGLMSGNVGMTVQGNRFEVNNLGLNIGAQFPPGVGGGGSNNGGLQHAVMLTANSFERNIVCLQITSLSAGMIVGNSFTGTVAPANYTITGISWNNGIVTVTVSKPLTGYFGSPLTGTKQIKLEDVNVGSYNGYHACTIVDPTHFTFPLATDPGPVTLAGHKSWSIRCQAGIYTYNMANTLVAANDWGLDAELGHIYADPAHSSGAFNAFIANGCRSVVPPVQAGMWDFWRANACDEPVYTFGQLPGQPDVLRGAVQGDEYFIRDANTGSFGAQITGGGGSNFVRARYQQGAWVVA